MPVEIRELVIRAVVHDGQEAHAPAPPAASADPQAFDALVEECVRQVLKILKQSGER